MIVVTAGKFHSKDCLHDYAMNKTDRVIKSAQVAKKKVHAKRKREYYANDLPKQKALTQTVFNKLRKLQEFKWFADRGLEPECISCGKTGMDWCCGHFKTVGAHPELRYDERNTYLQCNKYCNSSLSGNINGNKTSRGFLVGVFERFGQIEGGKIIDYCNDYHKSKKWTCGELIEMRRLMNIEIKELTTKLTGEER